MINYRQVRHRQWPCVNAMMRINSATLRFNPSPQTNLSARPDFLGINLPFVSRPPTCILLAYAQAALISMFPGWASAVIALRCGPPDALRGVLARAAMANRGLPPGAWRGKTPADMAGVFAVVVAHTHEAGWLPGSAAAVVRAVCGQTHPFARLIYIDDSSSGRAAAAEAAAELQRHACCASRGTVLWATTPLGRAGAQRAAARFAQDGETVLFLDPGAGVAGAATAAGWRGGPRVLADEHGLFRLSEALYSACRHWNMTSDEAAGLQGGCTLPLVAVGEISEAESAPPAAADGNSAAAGSAGGGGAVRVWALVPPLEAAGGGSRGLRGLPLDGLRWAAAAAQVVRAVPDAALMDWECRWLPDAWAEVAWSLALAERAGGRAVGTRGLRLLAAAAAAGGEAGGGAEMEEGDYSDEVAQPERVQPSAGVDSDSDARGEERAPGRRLLGLTEGGVHGGRRLASATVGGGDARLEAWVRGDEGAWGGGDEGGGGGVAGRSIRDSMERSACRAPHAAVEVLHGQPLTA